MRRSCWILAPPTSPSSFPITTRASGGATTSPSSHPCPHYPIWGAASFFFAPIVGLVLLFLLSCLTFLMLVFSAWSLSLCVLCKIRLYHLLICYIKIFASFFLFYSIFIFLIYLFTYLSIWFIYSSAADLFNWVNYLSNPSTDHQLFNRLSIHIYSTSLRSYTYTATTQVLSIDIIQLIICNSSLLNQNSTTHLLLSSSQLIIYSSTHLLVIIYSTYHLLVNSSTRYHLFNWSSTRYLIYSLSSIQLIIFSSTHLLVIIYSTDHLLVYSVKKRWLNHAFGSHRVGVTSLVELTVFGRRTTWQGFDETQTTQLKQEYNWTPNQIQLNSKERTKS